MSRAFGGICAETCR